MTNTVLKKKIVSYVEHVNDENILQTVYNYLNSHVIITEDEISVEDLKIIAVRKKAIMNGTEKTYTAEEVRKKLLKKLGK